MPHYFRLVRLYFAVCFQNFMKFPFLSKDVLNKKWKSEKKHLKYIITDCNLLQC